MEYDDQYIGGFCDCGIQSAGGSLGRFCSAECQEADYNYKNSKKFEDDLREEYKRSTKDELIEQLINFHKLLATL